MVLDTAVQEFVITVWIAIWTTFFNLLGRYFYFPSSIPFNLVFNFAAVTTSSPDVVLGTANFSWLRQIVRVITDCVVIGIGVLALYLLFFIFGIDTRYGVDPRSLLETIDEKNSILANIVLAILHYISNFALFGNYRLAWNLICIPFLHVFSIFMQNYFPQAPP